MSENKAQKWNRSFFSSLTTARVRKWRSKPRSKSDATTLDALDEKGSRKIQKNNTKNGKVISNSNPEVQNFSISVEEFQIENNLNTRAFRSNSCCSKTSHEDESMPSESESERQVSPVLPVKKEDKCQALAAELEACTKPSSVSLLNMLRDLSSVIKYNECIAVLEEICERCSFVGAIVEQMKRLPKHVDVQKCGCNLLCDLAFASGKLKQQIQTTDCALHVLYLLDIHAENGSIQAAALKTIGVLAQSAPVRQLLLERDKDLLGKLLVALSSFQNQPDVPARACYALRMILDTDKETYDSLMNGEEYRLVIDALKKNPHSVPVVLEACNMMRDLMKLGSPLLLHHQEPDLASLICKCLKEHVENKEVFVACLGVLEKLSMNADVQQQLLEEELHVFVLNGLMKNPEDVNLQAFGLGVLANMAASVLNFELPQSLDEEMWLKQVYIAMREHFGEPSVQEVACQLLSQLLEHCPDLIDKIGEDSEKNQDPIHAHCLGVILMHGRDADVFIAACNAIYWLAADNTRLRTFLTDRNAYIAILHGMKLHKKLPKAQEYACKAIRGLCIFSEDNKKLMMHQGTLNYLIRALTIFPMEVGVQIEATAAIACLADVEIMRNEQVLKKVHRRVLSAMKTHRTSDNLQEVGMEALSIFAAAAGGVQLLNDIEALTQIVDAMSRFKDSFVIQKKGLMLIQLLAEGATIAKDQEKVLAKVIMNAMRNFEDSLTVQAEGCVAIQVLAENKEEFSDVLVEIGAHECLFDILEEFDERPQYLLDLASECLYVLSCVRDLKSRMLLTACMKGMLQSVECLVELGADVNIGSGHRTPLCYAVLRGHEDLVKFLLKQGVTDLPRALRLSLEQEDNDSITGILLKYIGHNKQSGLGSFSGLNLGALKPSWLFPTLTGTTFVAPVSVEGKNMALKVQSCKEKRRQRQLVKESIPQDTASPQLQLRYTFSRGHLMQQMKKPNPGLVLPTPKKAHSHPGLSEKERCGSYDALDGATPRRKSGMQIMKELLFKASSQDDNSYDALQVNKSQQSNKWRRKTLATSSFREPSPTPESQDRRRSSLVTIAVDETDNSKVKPPKSPSFSFQKEEFEEWKKGSVSGANTPFSRFDPRLTPEAESKDYLLEEIPWTSKFGRQGTDISKKIASPLKRPSLPVTPSRKITRPLKRVKSNIEKGTPGSPYLLSVEDYLLPVPKIVITRKPADMVDTPPSISLEDLLLPRRKFTNEPGPIIDISSLTSTTKNVSFSHVEQFESILESSLECSESSIPSGSNSNIPEMPRKRSLTEGNLPGMVCHQQDLVSLDVSSNRIGSLSDLMDKSLLVHFQAIQKLDLSQNHLQNVPDELFEYLPKLEELYLRYNFITTFPAQALACKGLKIMDLSFNHIEDISKPPATTSFSIHHFNISQNRLGSIPDWISDNMPGLTELDIKGNKITKLPDRPLLLKKLHTLDIAQNYLTEIPEQFLEEFNALEKLDASCNELEKLPSPQVAKTLPKLQTLKLSRNRLGQEEAPYIPKFILHLERLESLDLSHNDLTDIPTPKNWKTPNLREFFLGNNKIEKLNLGGEEARLWSGLERLEINHNELSEVPKEIGLLSSLTSLDIGHNSILTLPDEMGRLNKLWELRYDRLELDLPQAILKGRTRDLIVYLSERLRNASEHYRMKMMVVGYAGRGKSTLIRTLMKLPQPDKSIATVGVQVKDWELRTGRRKPPHYTLSTWDFAGQEEFYNTHQCFLSNRSLYLVVYNLQIGPSEVETLRPWLLNIKARAPHSPVIIVGTHKDGLAKDEREQKIKEMRSLISELCCKPGFPDVKAVIELNCCYESSDIERLRDKIKEAVEGFKIKGQPVMGQKIPESFIKLEELVSYEAKARATLPVIKAQTLRKIIKDANLDLDNEELKQAVRFLHESGVMLHYEDASQQLENFYFLDPQWLGRMMAQVITVREINPFIDEKGILRKTDINLLFNGKRFEKFNFPTSLIPQYLRLLEKFEIILPRGNDEFLIPCRLPAKKPPISFPGLSDVVDSNGNRKPIQIQRQYEMPYIPLGFWSRLIARLVVFIPKMSANNPDSGVVPETVYWIEGICVYWSELLYFMIEPFCRDGHEVVVITVPLSKMGTSVLGHIVDHIDTLIEEWYPGLTEKSPTGLELVQRIVPCSQCIGPSIHHFVLDDLVSQSELDASMNCPNCGPVPLSRLAPDVIFADLEDHFQIDPQSFFFNKSPEYLLGDGGFGSVYRAKYKNKEVAVKVFNAVGDIHPHKMMRQEVTIIRELNHPSLISMVAVGVNPRAILLEVAPLGSLGSLLKTRTLGRAEQQRIAMQVAEGMAYLHHNMIIYRDMKPENILIFNLALGPNVVINAKISDYGISRFAAPCGLRASEGTPGYRAPEVIRGEVYGAQADMYSFGMTLYELVTNGRHPYDDLSFRNQLDEAVLMKRPINPITTKLDPMTGRPCCQPWPDMQDVIYLCLKYVPEERPTAAEIHEKLERCDLLSLRNFLPISKNMTVECMTLRHDGDGMELWVGSGGSEDCAQLSWVSLTENDPKILDLTLSLQGKFHPDSRILCLTTIGSSCVLIGCLSGHIWVYDAYTREHKHKLPRLPDSVLCMHFHQNQSGDAQVYVGLASGQLAIFDANNVLTDAFAEPSYTLRFGESSEPIRCIVPHTQSKTLYIGCGSKIVMLLPDTWRDIPQEIDTATEQSRGIICAMVVSRKYLYLAKMQEATVEAWDLNKQVLKHTIDIYKTVSEFDPSMKLSRGDCRVTSLLLQNTHTLWVGTGEGLLVILDTNSLRPCAVLKRHRTAVRCMINVILKSQRGTSCVVTGGFGFHTFREEFETAQDEKTYGYIAMWDGGLDQHARQLQEYQKRRHGGFMDADSMSVHSDSFSVLKEQQDWR